MKIILFSTFQHSPSLSHEPIPESNTNLDHIEPYFVVFSHQIISNSTQSCFTTLPGRFKPYNIIVSRIRRR